jgi:hypothetical protein
LTVQPVIQSAISVHSDSGSRAWGSGDCSVARCVEQHQLPFQSNPTKPEAPSLQYNPTESKLSSKMQMIKVLLISFIATASATCGTQCGGCTAPCVNDPSAYCFDCGFSPCEDVSGYCWSCAGADGNCYAYDCVLCAIRPDLRPHPFPYLYDTTTPSGTRRAREPHTYHVHRRWLHLFDRSVLGRRGHRQRGPEEDQLDHRLRKGQRRAARDPHWLGHVESRRCQVSRRSSKRAVHRCRERSSCGPRTTRDVGVFRPGFSMDALPSCVVCAPCAWP